MTRLPWAVLLLTLLGARYLSWRLSASLNLATPLSTTLSLLTLAAELVLLARETESRIAATKESAAQERANTSGWAPSSLRVRRMCPVR